jgi:hypothetical protein
MVSAFLLLFCISCRHHDNDHSAGGGKIRTRQAFFKQLWASASCAVKAQPAFLRCQGFKEGVGGQDEADGSCELQPSGPRPEWPVSELNRPCRPRLRMKIASH